MRILSIVVVCIILLSGWLWKQNAALRAEFETLEDQRAGLSNTSSDSNQADSTIQSSPLALSTVEEAVLELSKYGMGDITKEASVGDKIFDLKEDQLPEVLEILTSGPAIGTSSLGGKTSLVQALFEHWSRLNLKEAMRAADSLNGDSKTSALRGIVMHLIDTDFDAAIELASTPVIKSKRSGMGNDRLYGPVISAMARRDPRKAADFALNGSYNNSANPDNNGLLIVTRIWAETDPLAALEWARQHVDSELRRGAEFGIHMVWAQRNRSSAIDSALSLEDNDSREFLLGHLIYSWGQQDREAALNYLTNGLPEAHRSATLFESVGSGFGRASLDSVLNAAQSIDDIELREGFLGKAAEERLEYDGKAIALASHLREGPLKNRVFESVMKNWTQFDLEAASDWLGSAQESPSRDVAIQALTSKLVASNPERAIEWAAAISNAEQREKSIDSLAEEWLKKDSESAAQWIKHTTYLTPAAKKRILP